MKYHNKEPLRHVGDIPARGAAQYGEKAALVYHGDELSYADLEARANQIANALVDEGVEPGDRVGILMENNLRYMPILFGIMKSGAVPVPLNYRMDQDSLVYVLEDSAVDVLVGSEADYFAELLVDLHEAAALSRTYVPGGGDHDVLEDYDAWLEGRLETFDRPERDFEDVTLQCYTSGTTGDPKGVLHSHRNLLVSVEALEGRSGTDPERETTLSITPLFHGFGLIGTTLQQLYAGGTIVLRNLPEPDALLEAITEYDVTTFAAVPAIFIEMVNELEANPERYDVSTLQRMGCAAAPLADDTRRRIEDAFGNPLVEGWAMTEIGPAGCTDSVRGIQKGAGCVGQPLSIPGFELKLVDPETRETRVPWSYLDPTAPADLTDYEPDFDDETTYTGEIAVKGPQVMKGYHDMPEKNATVFDDWEPSSADGSSEERSDWRDRGWFYTGDIARVDEDRSMWMVDRADDMMIVGGENVYPAEVEDALFDHEAVEEAAVVAAPHEVKGEAPVAYVVLGDGYAAGADVTETELRRFALDHVASYAHPRRVFFVAELPRSGTEKVQRYKLEERAERELDGPLTSSEKL